MKATTKELIAAIAERGYITEQEINLLKRRANAGDKDVSGIYDIEYLSVTEEHANKGYKWLKNLHYTPFGKVRSNSPFGAREIYIIDNPDFDVIFKGFIDITRNKDFKVNVPVYDFDGMEYYVSGGKINIIG